MVSCRFAAELLRCPRRGLRARCPCAKPWPVWRVPFPRRLPGRLLVPISAPGLRKVRALVVGRGVAKMAASLPPVVRVKIGRVPAVKAPQWLGRRPRRPGKRASTVVGVYAEMLQVRKCLRLGLGLLPRGPGGPLVPTSHHLWPLTVNLRRGVVPLFFFVSAPGWRYRLGWNCQSTPPVLGRCGGASPGLPCRVVAQPCRGCPGPCRLPTWWPESDACLFGRR